MSMAIEAVDVLDVEFGEGQAVESTDYQVMSECFCGCLCSDEKLKMDMADLVDMDSYAGKRR